MFNQFCNQSKIINKSLKLNSFLQLNNNFSKSFFSTTNGNSVYVWKANVNLSRRSDDYSIKNSIRKQPQKIEFFEGKNPNYIYVGPRHTGVVTKTGELYTFGSGNWGILGHGDESSVGFNEPKIVEYFAKNNIKIKKVCLGDYHSIALSESGKVYTWGFGGEKGVLFGIFRRDPGALGHGTWKHYFTPKEVSYFAENNIKVKDISCGITHSIVLSEDGNIYSFGRGPYGLLGNSSTKDQITPKIIELLRLLKSENPQDEVVKIDCADEYTAALTKGGDLYVWGKNNQGQLGIGAGIGIDMTESQSYPVKMPKVDETKKIVDFSCGENGMLIKTEDNIVYKTGWNIDYVMSEFQVSHKINTKILFVGNSYYGLVSDKNEIFQFGKLFKSKMTQVDDMMKIEEELFDKRNIKSISGKFKICGAIVN